MGSQWTLQGPGRDTICPRICPVARNKKGKWTVHPDRHTSVIPRLGPPFIIPGPGPRENNRRSMGCGASTSRPPTGAQPFNSLPSPFAQLTDAEASAKLDWFVGTVVAGPDAVKKQALVSMTRPRRGRGDAPKRRSISRLFSSPHRQLAHSNPAWTAHHRRVVQQAHSPEHLQEGRPRGERRT